MTAPYRSRVNALAVITSAAFFGANLFIGLSMGVYWLSLPPADFVAQFFPQFSNFLFTIMPLFVADACGPDPVGPARLAECPGTAELGDRAVALPGGLADHDLLSHAAQRASCGGDRVADGGCTGFLQEHCPGRSGDGGERSHDRGLWLLGHIPRILVTFATAIFVLRALAARTAP
jgi:hypothetical protein